LDCPFRLKVNFVEKNIDLSNIKGGGIGGIFLDLNASVIPLPLPERGDS
jgi:hypothetical protein